MDGSEILHQLKTVAYPIIYRVSAIQSGAVSAREGGHLGLSWLQLAIDGQDVKDLTLNPVRPWRMLIRLGNLWEMIGECSRDLFFGKKMDMSWEILTKLG